ncbi:MAG: hypothetical protein AABW51_02270 [Nanoarchaeota archaeon]
MNFILKIFAFFYTRWIHKLERELGYKLKFEKIPKTWINGLMTFDMERSWRKQGIEAKGVNYFTVGSLIGDLSSRFIRDKRQYQSWLGAYLVKFKDSRKFTLQDHYDLAVADQKNWLGDFGDPNPFYEMPEENTGKVQNIMIGNYSGKLYEFLGGLSHSDVGNKNSNMRNKILMALMASMFNRYNSKLSLNYSNFIPKHPFSNYETVTLKGYIAIVDLDNNTKVVLYGNGTIINNKAGKKSDYSSLLKKDILTAFKSVIITKL